LTLELFSHVIGIIKDDCHISKLSFLFCIKFAKKIIDYSQTRFIRPNRLLENEIYNSIKFDDIIIRFIDKIIKHPIVDSSHIPFTV
jgi:hypothetical protein